jgi:hypothetical protein
MFFKKKAKSRNLTFFSSYAVGYRTAAAMNGLYNNDRREEINEGF